jgi:hypothetical protein
MLTGGAASASPQFLSKVGFDPRRIPSVSVTLCLFNIADFCEQRADDLVVELEVVDWVD